MNASTFHLRFADSQTAREQGLALRQQGLDHWHQNKDDAGSVLYSQGSILLMLAEVLIQREQNAVAFRQLPLLENSSAQALDLHAAAHALCASCDGLVLSALNILEAMKASVMHAEKLSRSEDALERAGASLHLSLSEHADDLIKHVLKPLPTLRSEAAQVLRRYAHAQKRD